MTFTIQYSAKSIDSDSVITNKIASIPAYSKEHATEKLRALLRERGFELTGGRHI